MSDSSKSLSYTVQVHAQILQNACGNDSAGWLCSILGHLAHPADGLDVRDWTQYALVCRTWRKAMEEVSPLTLNTLILT